MRAKLTDFDDVKAHLVGQLWNDVKRVLSQLPISQVHLVPLAVCFEGTRKPLASHRFVVHSYFSVVSCSIIFGTITALSSSVSSDK